MTRIKTFSLPLLITLALSALSAQAQFVRTEAILFQDDLRQERIGDFPSRWDLCRGRRVTGVPTATG